MSLINDALKKAQKQRTEESPLSSMPSIGGEPAARIAKRSKPLGFNSLLLWVGLGGGMLVILAVGAFFLVRFLTRSQEPTPVVKTATVAPVVPTSADPVVVISTATPAPSSTTLPAPSVEVETPVPVVETKPVILPTPEPELPKPVVPVPKLPPKAVAYIEALHVSGIRASATDSKVLMNDRVYRVGDTVEHNLGLKLAAITSNSLTFEDEFGARYTRSF